MLTKFKSQKSDIFCVLRIFYGPLALRHTVPMSKWNSKLCFRNESTLNLFVQKVLCNNFVIVCSIKYWIVLWFSELYVFRTERMETWTRLKYVSSLWRFRNNVESVVYGSCSCKQFFRINFLNFEYIEKVD